MSVLSILTDRLLLELDMDLREELRLLLLIIQEVMKVFILLVVLRTPRTPPVHQILILPHLVLVL